jgi:glycosyltransferase involved in cell wall biosynthesis
VSRRQRIAVVSDSIHPYHHGGKETRWDELLHRLAASDFDIDLYTMRWWGDAPPLGDTVHLRALCRNLAMYDGARRSLTQAVRFSAACLRLLGPWHSFDAIDADQIPFLQIYTLKLVALMRRKPLIVTWHEVWGAAYWDEYLGGFLGEIATVLERWAVRLPSHIIAASEQTAQGLRALHRGELSVTVVPNGIDLAAVRGAEPAERGADILFVGRLMTHKNVHLLLDALVRLRAEGQRPTCQIVGEGPESERLREQAGLAGLLDGQVEFLGRVETQQEVYSLIKSARLVAVPSVREGYGIAVAEALACGTPVLTTDHPDNAARHLIQDHVNGLLCRPDAASIADTLRSALREPLRVNESAAAEQLDWDALAARVAEVYRAVCDRRAVPSRPAETARAATARQPSEEGAA